MQKINHTKLNRSNNDIWGTLNIAVKTKNIALIESNLSRLYAMQKYLLELLEFQESEILSFKNHLAETQKTLESFEKDWIEKIAKDNGVYEEVRERINKTFRS